MMISTRGRYALRVMLDLAENGGEGYVPMKEVAQRQELPLKYIEQLMPALVKAGFVEGVQAEDGAAQDVYLLGEDGPVEAFEGRVIAVYRREADVEDKWIVSSDGRDYPDEFILEKIAFQERFFHGMLLR